ncbi:hypothetical protein [Nemorincola caseinilytica]
MKRRPARRYVICLFVLLGMALVGSGCKTQKNCGCGSDIFGSYKAPKRYR